MPEVLIRRIKSLWNERPWGALLLILFFAYSATVIWDAWLCDDAYITFRVVDNLINGHGPVWNVEERVQVFTNPLMMLLTAAVSFVIRDVYPASLIVCLTASIAAVAVLSFKVARSRVLAVAALGILTFSWSFVSYSTSGLENCLTFLISALFFWTYFSRERYSAGRLLALTALFALALVNRLDTALLLMPALTMAYIRHESVAIPRLIGSLFAGLLPIIFWLGFATAYYGFPFPNTAYAKLNTGIPLSEYLVRGFWYYRMSFWQDPIVLLAIAFCSILIIRDRQPRIVIPFLGVILYLVYVVTVGDFMRGRFFAAPLFVALLLLASIEPARWRPNSKTPGGILLGVLVIALLSNIGLLFFRGMSWESWAPYGILDDKRIYYQFTNLPTNMRAPARSFSPHVQAGREMRDAGTSPVVTATVGLRGYYAGPDVHIIDPLGLGDPLLSRLPGLEDPDWMPGHIWRDIPDGYVETIASGQNMIQDAELAAYYDQLTLITRGPLWTRERWRAIVDMNLGRFDHLIDWEYYRYEAVPPYDPETLW